jgi:hypothetical protein
MLQPKFFRSDILCVYIHRVTGIFMLFQVQLLIPPRYSGVQKYFSAMNHSLSRLNGNRTFLEHIRTHRERVRLDANLMCLNVSDWQPDQLSRNQTIIKGLIKYPPNATYLIIITSNYGSQ